MSNYYSTYALLEQLLNYICTCEGEVRDAPLSRSQSLYELKEYKCCTLWICYTLASMTTLHILRCAGTSQRLWNSESSTKEISSSENLNKCYSLGLPGDTQCVDRCDYNGSMQTTQVYNPTIVRLYYVSTVLQSLHYPHSAWCERHTITIGVTIYDYRGR